MLKISLQNIADIIQNFFFLNTLRKNKIFNVSNILFNDKKNLYLIFEIIKGKKIRKVSRDDIKECLKFLKKINSKKS